MAMPAVEQAVILARVAERAERYDEMAEFMKERVQTGGPLSGEERDLFSAAFKGTLNGRRLAVRVATSVESQENKEGRSQQANLAAGYRSKVESELQLICQDATALLKQLVPNAERGEPQAFYLKMLGDYCRYMAEFTTGEQRLRIAEEAKDAYGQATAVATETLLTTHPVRLGLALNFSVFQHEVLGDKISAINTAHAALASAGQDIQSVNEEAANDAALTMQLLQDNLQLWGTGA